MRYHPYFTLKKKCTVEALSKMVSCELVAGQNANHHINNISTLSNANQDSITFLSSSQYSHQAKSTGAAACIASFDDAQYFANNQNISLLLCDDPHLTYVKILNIMYTANTEHLSHSNIEHKGNYYSDKTAKIGTNCHIGSNVHIGYMAEIGEGCTILANSYIGPYCKIGALSRIGSNVSIIHSQIGEKANILSGARIGEEGFGYAKDHSGSIIEIMQMGQVIVGHNVLIGANSTIDRGSLDNTIIGNNTKIDNLVQIGHNVQIGQNCYIVAQSGIAGSAILGNNVTVAGQSGINGHVHIGDNAVIAARSGVVGSVESNKVLCGYPALDIKQWKKMHILLKKMLQNNNKSTQSSK